MGQACECSHTDKYPSKDYNLRPMLDDRSSHDIYDSWYHEVLFVYTRRQLGYNSDRLPALAGAAKIYQTALGDGYLAGLWGHDMLKGLGWRRAYLEPPSSVSPGMRVPSWSWASTNRDITYPKGDLITTFVEVLDARCFPPQDVPFGLVDGGYVSLRGPVAEGYVDFPEDGLLPWADTTFIRSIARYSGFWCFHFHSDSRLALCASNAKSNDIVSTEHLILEEITNDETVLGGLSRGKRAGKVCCLPLGIVLDDGKWLYMSALVLSRTNGQEFRRLGHIYTGCVKAEGQPFLGAEIQTVTII